MTELSEQDAASAVAVQSATSSQSAGELLSQARHVAGLEIEAVANALKVPVVRVRALEANQWGDFSDVVFIRALATSMCRLLKLPSGPVLELLPQAGRKVLKVDDGINSPLRRPSGAVVIGRSRLPQVPLVWAAGALSLAIGAGVLAWLLPASGDFSTKGSKSNLSEGQQMGAVVMVTSIPQVVTSASALAASTTASVPVVTAAMVGTSPASALDIPLASTGGASAIVVQPSASALASAAAGGARVQFQTSAASWVEVTDSKGTTVLRKLTAAGETVAVVGLPPLSVLVGRVDVTRVEVRGKVMDLNAIARDNVARFEVK